VVINVASLAIEFYAFSTWLVIVVRHKREYL